MGPAEKKQILRASLHISGFAFFLLISFISAGFFIASPLAISIMINEGGGISAVNILIICALLAIGHTIQASSVFLKNSLVQRYYVKLSSRLYENIFKLQYDEYLEMGPSALQSRVHDTINSIATFYFATIPGIIVNTITVIATLIIVFTISPLVAIIMFLTLPLNYFGYRFLNRKLSKMSIKLSKVCSAAWREENAIISNVDFIRQNSDNSRLLPLIEQQINKAQDITRLVNNHANGMSLILTALNQIIKNALLLFMAALMLADVSMVSGAVFIMIALPYFSSSVSGLTNINLNISGLKVADDFIKELLDKKDVDEGQDSIEEIKEIRLKIDRLSIKGKGLIHDIDFVFKQGDIVGILGESGCGKSSLVKLIAKFRHGDGVYVNGKPLSRIKNESYLSLVSYYSQNTPIITDSIVNNLNFGISPKDEKFYKQLGFLKKFDNMNEDLIENGANLSEGDKQRIALSRCFAENTDVLILDEPTSSLDAETEADILSEIIERNRKKIIFLVSHNNENMKFCNRILEIKDKKIFESISA